MNSLNNQIKDAVLTINQQIIDSVFKQFDYQIKNLTSEYFLLVFQSILEIWDDEELINEFFRICDKNEDGFVDYIELIQNLETVCLSEQVENQCRIFCRNFKDKNIKFEELLSYINSRKENGQDNFEFVQDLFEELDYEELGFINYWDLYFKQINLFFIVKYLQLIL
ncbi:hypothetical protein PPERSA_10371 [Pseudocohnilembus persalinus]|uniref:EF-hand domain-containing protein n=1 Tax=Pseudocohnilembus persalinus TaxID=266149 RepID=A0A0V0QNE8_PSEPJ|nr:hypothetical protein PPERSA_10371 [Pseudocohnilembus persalinus]|eukprot:KRX03687.1 hypothetical protein PPERSA_10371 [Pseudocohnilembus persalinus]